MNLTCFSLVVLYGIIMYHLIAPTLEYDGTLKLVHVLFRHGNRTPSHHMCYPNDPHHNETYFPFGIGQLTNKGKPKEFRLGIRLRNRYGSFLGNVYRPEIIYALTRPYDRTKMSMELVLAALFPSANTVLDWNKALNWQPIPYNYAPPESELLGTPFWDCPNYSKLYEDFLKSPAGIASTAPYKELFDYVKLHTGWNVTVDNKDLWGLYNTLNAQSDWGLKLPTWAQKIFPQPLSEAAGQSYIQFTYTAGLRQLSGGFLLKKIIADSRNKIDDVGVHKERKIFLYSGQDLTIGNTLGSMGLMYPHQPPFGAYVLMELHKINNVYGFKVLYQNYSDRTNTPLLMRVPGCDTFCPFDKFVALHNAYLPIGNDPCSHNDKEVVHQHNIYCKNNMDRLRCAL